MFGNDMNACRLVVFHFWRHCRQRSHSDVARALAALAATRSGRSTVPHTERGHGDEANVSSKISYKLLVQSVTIHSDSQVCH